VLHFQMDPYQITSAVVLASIILIETLFPFRKYFDRVKHFGKNAVFSLINAVITGVSSAVLNVGVFLWIEKNNIGLLQQFPMPAVVSAAIAFLLFDLWIYSWHRLNHVVPFLWRFHQIHHNDLEMDMSTAFRFHPGEIFLASLVNVVVFTILGMRLDQIIIYKLVFHLNVFIHHSNVAVPERWDKVLRLIIVSPNMHRVHHSMKREETDSNFASVFSFWDRIFRTFRESEPQKIVFGLEEDRTAETQTVSYLLKLPFKRSKRRNNPQ